MASILVVDDRPENRQYLVKLLGYAGHRLLEASDGVEGLKVARDEVPDLIISDILMPTMDGFGFVRRLREQENGTRTPVVFCTATYQASQVEHLARACGVHHILAKPCKPEKVLDTVNEILKLDQSHPPVVLNEQAHDEHFRLITSKLYENLDGLGARLAAIIDHALELASVRDPRLLLERFCLSARKIIGARNAVVSVGGEDGQQPHTLLTSGMDEESAAGLNRALSLRGMLNGMFTKYRSCRLHNLRDEFPEADELWPGLPISSLLAVPIVSLTRRYGWLCLLNRMGEDEFSEEDERLAGILGAQLGRVYENGSLYTELQRREADLREEVAERRRTEVLLREQVNLAALSADVGLALTHSTNLREMLQLCAETMVRNLGAAFTRVWMLDPSETVLELQASAGLYTHLDGPHSRVPVGMYKIGLIAQERQPRLTNNVQNDPRISDHEWALREGMVAFAGYPLLVDHRLVGVVALFARNPLTEATLQTLGAVANQIAVGIERKRAEESFRTAEQRLRYVVSASPSVTYWLAVDGDTLRPTWMSDNILGLTGYEVGEALRPGWWEQCLHPDDCQAAMDNIPTALRQDRFTQEYRIQHKNGTPCWILDEMRVVRDALGRPSEVVGSWTNINGRKQLEAQFFQAQKMDAVGRLAGGVAHDFNNLLTVINGYSEFALDGLRQEDPLRDFLKEIKKAGERATSLTRQLLAFSRKQVLVPEVVDLNNLVADMEKMLCRLIGEDIELHVSTQPDLWSVKADPGQIEQVVMNIIINARDAMPKGGKLVLETRNAELDESYVRTHRSVRPGAYVLLAVSDTGCGMDKATQAKIFEPFFSTKGERGTGLGLATVYGIVKQSDGHIEVYSEVGLGTTFKVYLPRNRAGVVTATPRHGLTSARGGTETVLLVEDEAGVRALAHKILRHHGYTVLEACNGENALSASQRHAGPIHLLVTDVVMLGMSGREAAERLATLRPGLRVLYLSGYTDDAIVHHGVLEAGTPFLHKPFTPQGLARKVREVLDAPIPVGPRS